ncbi:MAG: tetratricopeptide repeat protein [Deltaproteobacteria bacterium]|nr:tetratricopeptide repeat protein [Deltaproteobacteria bacterium]
MDQISSTPSTGDPLDIAARVRRRLFDAPSADLHIGRFRVLTPLGRGNMGMVYAAYDEQLDRKVAVKIMLEDVVPSDEERLRFQREGQALARLSHPNVVAVHEVGWSNAQFYLAMEYVRGQSLDSWLSTNPPWAQVLDAFVQAGRGMAAAHQAELVHRDLKPSNIMRGDDGIVKVVDFGIARLSSHELDESLDADFAMNSVASACETLTLTGAVLGTPAYMAPEQFTATGADDRSDQYAFCVALWEGLTGRRPFEARDVDNLHQKKLAGPPRWPNRAPPVPRTVVEALRRGLCVDPEERWPSMERLLLALSWDPHRRRNRWTLAAAAMAAVGLGATTVRALNEAHTPPCTGARDALSSTWDEARRSQVETAIVHSNESYADGVRARTLGALDEYADAWTQGHTEACEATTVRGEVSPRIMDLRMSCLHRAADQLSATVETLADADPKVIRKAHELVANLPPLWRCSDIEALEADVEPPLPAEADAVAEARRLLARAKTLRTAGRYQPARHAVDQAAAALDGVEYGPVFSELMLTRGVILDHLGEYEAAEGVLRKAVGQASRWGQRRLMVHTIVGLMRVSGKLKQRANAAALFEPQLLGLAHGDPVLEAIARTAIANLLREEGEYERAAQEHRRALALRERAPSPSPLRIANSRNALGSDLSRLGKHDEAEAEFRLALELTTRALGSEHPDVADSRYNLGMVLVFQGKHVEAETEMRAALAVMERALGLDHPYTSDARSALGNALYNQGRYAEAQEHYLATLTATLERYGPDHPTVHSARNNLGNVMLARGQYALAEAEYRAAALGNATALGPEHPSVLNSRNNLAVALGRQGQYDEAETEIRAVVGARVEALGPEHPQVAIARNTLGNVLLHRGQYAAAETQLRTALASIEARLGPEHPHGVATRADLAMVLLGLDRAQEALPLAEQAWHRCQQSDIPAEQRAEASLVLAETLWALEGAGRDRARAEALVQEALKDFEAAGAAGDDGAPRAEQWLATHTVRSSR